MRQKNRGPTNPADPATWLCSSFSFFMKTIFFQKRKNVGGAGKKQWSNCPGQLNFDLGLVKIVVLWLSG